MNNVSVKGKLIFFVFMGFLIIPVTIIMILNNKYNVASSLLSITPFWLLYYWGNLLLYINCADINVNDSNDVIILRTIFFERNILLNTIKIDTHIKSRRLAFIFKTNLRKIIVNYTRNNYNTLLKILNSLNYKDIEDFIAYVEKRDSLIDLDGSLKNFI
jgi:hypothetical protein